MLPRMGLRDVMREDVERIADWLSDEEVASRWFGHYACGDPVHRGYEPRLMLKAPTSEWDRVFHRDPNRFVLSIYNESEEHIGECQVLPDKDGSAEISLLIGRKDLWHHRYGTAAVSELLSLVFDYYELQRAWVSVPESNVAALGLFEKLGFVHQETRRLCTRSDGTPLNSRILAISADGYGMHRDAASRRTQATVVTVAGLPGSDATAVSAEIARSAGFRLVDDEIPKRLSMRLKRSFGELAALEASYGSLWSRALSALLTPWERYGAFGGSDYYDAVSISLALEYVDPDAYLTKEKYLQGLKDVVTELALEGNVVLVGNGNHLFLPSGVTALRLFVQAPDLSRENTIAEELGVSLKDAQRLLKRADKECLSVSRHLFGSGLLDTKEFDLIVNMDDLSLEEAAESVVGMLEATTQDPHAAKRLSTGPAVLRAAGQAPGARDREFLATVDVFKGLSDAQVRKVAALGRMLHVSAGDILGEEGRLGDQVFVIIKGSAELSAHSAIGEITVRVAGPGESFPLAALIGAGTLITSVEAMADMELLVIRRSALLALFDDDSDIGMRMYASIAEVLADRYGRTLAHLTANAEAALREADFFDNV